MNVKEKHKQYGGTSRGRQKDIFCMCEIHLRTEKDLRNPLKCVGHGIHCPCTQLEKEKLDAEAQKMIEDKKEVISPQSTV